MGTTIICLVRGTLRSACACVRWRGLATSMREKSNTRRALRRTVGLAVHETGHVFGMPHCIAWLCRMNGSNNLEECDRRPLEYCPECLPKIWWTCNIDPARRFSRLLEFAREHHLHAEEKLWQKAGTLLAAAQKAAS